MKIPLPAGPAAFALIAGAMLLACPAGAWAQAAEPLASDAFRATTLNLSASGEVRAAPDMASIGVGVQTEAPTAAQAMSDNAMRMNQVIAALRRAGIEAKDIKTSGVNLGAQFDYQPNQPPRLTGYQASNQVQVSVFDLAKLGPTLDAVVAAGANQVNGVTFALKDPVAVENEARQKAVQALQAKAQLYAGATGFRTLRLVNLSEGGGFAPPRPVTVMSARAMAVDVAAPTPVEAGQLDVRIDISGVFELSK